MSDIEMPHDGLELARRWEQPEGYYQDIAASSVSPLLNTVSRGFVDAYTLLVYGRPIIKATKAFIDQQDMLGDGNRIVAAVHRDQLDTVILPTVLERVGVHHSRPITKSEEFTKHPLYSWFLHRNGAFAIDRENPDSAGINLALKAILSSGGNVTVYPEATRVRKNTRNVKNVGRMLAMWAALNDSIILPVAFAGLSTEMEGEKTDRYKVSRDKRSPFGINRRLVFVFEDPLRFGPMPDTDSERTILAEARKRGVVVKDAMQRALDSAYLIRGSSLERKY